MTIKNLLLKTTTIAICVSLSNFASAVPISEKYEVLKQAKNYSTAIACSTTFEYDKTTINDVFLLKADKWENEPEFGTGYLVFWSGDWGCNGGSGTYSSFLSYFSRTTNEKPFILETHDILDEINEPDFQINGRFIESVTINNDIIKIIASDFSTDPNVIDSNNFPSNRFEYTVMYNEYSGIWGLANKRYLGKNDYSN